MRPICTIIALFFLVAISTTAMSDVHYVSTTGSANWATCTDINSPCSSQTALTNAAADDIVYFRGGTYNPGTAGSPSYEYAAMNPSNSGSSGHPITFKAYPGETPIISGTATGASLGATYRDYIIWDGFSGTAVDAGGVTNFFVFWNSTGSIIRNCNFTGYTNDDSYNTMLMRFENASYCKAENNILHGMTGTGVNTCAMWVFASNHCEIYHNTIYSCSNGIMQKTGPNISNAYYRNLIYSILSYGIYLNEQSATGTSCSVYQNVVVDTVNAIHLEGVSASYTINDYQIYNNTIHGSGSGITLTDYCRDTLIWNNIIYGANDPYVRYYEGSSLPDYSDYNDYYHSTTDRFYLNYNTNYSSLSAWRTATGLDTNSVSTDPGFDNAGGTDSTDYRRSSYTANGRGGGYASVMGAWISDGSPTQIGYSTDASAHSNMKSGSMSGGVMK